MITATAMSNNTMTVILDNGRLILSATKDHPKWAELVNAYNQQDETALIELFNMKRIVEKYTSGGLVVSDNGVFYKDMPLTGIDVDRLLAFMRQGLPYQPIANFMVRKLLNPSKRAIDEMYNFLEHKNMPLTPEGKIIAYKGVQKDFFSVSSGGEPLIRGRRNEGGQIFNGVGETIEMDRCWVDDDFRQACSSGLHAGSLGYAKGWAEQHNGIIILIEIDPPDVVSVPTDCNCTKCRCRKYKVIGVYDGPLPDTYTSDFSEKPEDTLEEGNECPECGETLGRCVCDDNCQQCGLPEDECVCTEDEIPIACQQAAQPSGPLTEGRIDSESIEGELTIPESFNLRQKVVAILCTHTGLNPDQITDFSHMKNDLGLDSLDGVELALTFEKEFGVEIPNENIERCVKVGDIIRELNTLLKRPQVTAKSTSYSNTSDTEKRLYEEGYQLGLRNGIRRRKRLYREGDDKAFPHSQVYIKGYNAGYLDGRWDYIKK